MMVVSVYSTGHFYRHRVALYFFPCQLSARAFLQYHFYTAVFKKTPSNCRYSIQPGQFHGAFPRGKKKKRKIVTYRNQRESNSVERDDLDRNATRTMSLQDEIPVRIRMDHSVTIISRPCGFVGRYYPPRNSLRAFHRPQSKSSL